MVEKPPPVLSNSRVLAYAILNELVAFSGHSSVFVGTATKGLKELGPVPCLAIVEELETGELMLLYCDEEWDQLAVGGRYESVEQAKARAERTYHGVSACWIDPMVTREEALKFRDEVWADHRCSFCGKLPPDINIMIEGNNARICDACIERCHKILEEERGSSQ